MREKNSVWAEFLVIFMASGLMLAVESFGSSVVPDITPDKLSDPSPGSKGAAIIMATEQSDQGRKLLPEGKITLPENNGLYAVDGKNTVVLKGVGVSAVGEKNFGPEVEFLLYHKDIKVSKCAIVKLAKSKDAATFECLLEPMASQPQMLRIITRQVLPFGAYEIRVPTFFTTWTARFFVEKEKWAEEEKKRLDKRIEEVKKGADTILIPAGDFSMGMGVFAYPVRLSAYYIDKYEVTQELYEAVMGRNLSRFKGDGDLPVESVSWVEADEFCRKLGKRLPTEAEWEKAAKSGKNSLYPWGDNEELADRYAWFSANAGKKTHPVGQKEPNGYGVYDLAGNVWEWVSDWYDKDYYAVSPAVKVDPQGPSGIGQYRVLRGGSWNDGLEDMRSAERDYKQPLYWLNYIGFRCAASSFKP